MSVTFDMSFFFSECDIQYIDPSKYTPPDDGMPMRNGVDDDPYEKLVRGNLAKIEKQKVGRIKKKRNLFESLARRTLRPSFVLYCLLGTAFLENKRFESPKHVRNIFRLLVYCNSKWNFVLNMFCTKKDDFHTSIVVNR